MNRLRFSLHRLPTVLLCMAALLLPSCTTDDSDNYYKVGMGTLVREQTEHTPYSLLLDEERKPLDVKNSGMLTSKGITKQGQRVLASYSLTEKTKGRTLIHLREVFHVLTKPMIRPADQEETDRLGNDPVRILNAWRGGNHLNLKLRIQTTRMETLKQTVNTYDTGVTDSEGFRLFRLCHDLNGVTPTCWSPPLYVSFTLPETKELPSDIRLIYTDEHGQTKIITVGE